jgi:Lrp/AsnC family leucine-responsive transcriptional regulator
MDTESSFDGVDRRILLPLQADGRLTCDKWATQVGLSARAVLRRVKRLEESGVIAGDVALE